MINLVRLEVKNFLSFKEATLDLGKSGLYLISGWNQCGQDSNGSGKSAILGAICYALFGRTVTGLGPDAVKRWGANAAVEVSLALQEGSSSYLIRRVDNSIEFFENGLPTSATHKRDIQTVINDTFKTNYELFTSSTYFSSTRDFLAAQTDKEKKQLFKPIFQLDRLDKAYDKTKAAQDTLQTSLDNLSTYIATKRAILSEHRSMVARLEDSEKTWVDDIKSTITNLAVSRDAIGVETNADLVRRVDDLTDKIAIVEEDIATTSSLEKVWHEEWQNCQTAYRLAQEQWKENSEALAEIQLFRAGSICKYCGQPLTGQNLDSHKQEVLKKQDELAKKANEAAERSLSLDRLLLEQDHKRERLQSLKDVLRAAQGNLALHLQNIEDNKRRKAAIDDDIRITQASPCPFTTEIAKLKEQIGAEECGIEQAEVQMKGSADKYDALAFLKWVFSREGVSAYIIERAFGRLESLANRYLSMINTEGWQIEIRPQKELKSKALKEEIDIVILMGNQRVPYWGLSGGQRQRLNIALLLAVYRLCRDLGISNFNFLLLDEVLDLSLADKGQADAIRLMRRLLTDEIGSIFIISHKPDVAADFDFVIEVVRGKDKVSRIT